MGVNRDKKPRGYCTRGVSGGLGDIPFPEGDGVDLETFRKGSDVGDLCLQCHSTYVEARVCKSCGFERPANECQHGQLARSCEICDLESQLAAVAAERDRLRMHLKTALENTDCETEQHWPYKCQDRTKHGKTPNNCWHCKAKEALAAGGGKGEEKEGGE